MADSKKYDGSQWEHSLRKMTTATAEIEPTIYTDGTAITSYTIKGNTTQSGTPTPSNPITISGVGNKTANLLDWSSFADDYYLSTTTGLPAPYAQTISRIATLTPISVENVSSVTFTYTSSVSNTKFIYSLFNDDTLIRRVAENANGTTIDTSQGNKLYLCLYSNNSTVYTASITDGMLNEGATPQSFEPFGYKIPISTLQGSAVNYLGSVQTIRQIKKYVCTGQETLRAYDSQYSRIFIQIPDIVSLGIRLTPIMCTHYQGIYDGRPVSNMPNNSVSSGSPTQDPNGLYIYETDYTSNTDFAAFLATQYNNGTPVTIWYAVSTSETGIVNEPLMKIGDYSDSISNATAIPTTEGANSITVDTTVQPSEFSATWSGWHDASVKEYDGSDWQ